MKRFGFLAVCAVVLAAAAFGVGLGVAGRFGKKALPDPAAVVIKIRETAELETLRVALYKKISFAPEPRPADSFFGDVAQWTKFTFARPEGRAIVFAEASLSLSLDQLTEDMVTERNGALQLKLPPLQTRIELLPGETEVMGSNLSSQETAELLQAAKDGFARQVAGDRQLQDRAYRSAERSLQALLLGAGFREVSFTRP